MLICLLTKKEDEDDELSLEGKNTLAWIIVFIQ
jgi:hypothetical protein